MITLKTIAEVKAHINPLKERGEKIGFVPTMGYLHEGHLSLVRAAVKETDFAVVSIFVNPAQFDPSEDFTDYPRDHDRDLELLEKENVGLVFMPDEQAIYPSGNRTYVEVQDLQHKLCGVSRPTFFRGVCTIVLKLFNIITPDVSYFGQKDFQQALLIQRMVKDLNLEVDIQVLPIVRDQDGLALSSRNAYLSQKERKAALSLSRSLEEARRMVDAGERNPDKLSAAILEIIHRDSLLKIDYVEIVDLQDLDPLSRIKDSALIVLAVYAGKARLIDNIIIDTEETE